ncbi:hypothetical protein FQR65_LT14891 [Abscondita terminalis]|nr:hypothetical protein FQR65_LT14891 [Abscondita terminalis]
MEYPRLSKVQLSSSQTLSQNNEIEEDEQETLSNKRKRRKYNPRLIQRFNSTQTKETNVPGASSIAATTTGKTNQPPIFVQGVE